MKIKSKLVGLTLAILSSTTLVTPAQAAGITILKKVMVEIFEAGTGRMLREAGEQTATEVGERMVKEAGERIVRENTEAIVTEIGNNRTIEFTDLATGVAIGSVFIDCSSQTAVLESEGEENTGDFSRFERFCR